MASRRRQHASAGCLELVGTGYYSSPTRAFSPTRGRDLTASSAPHNLSSGRVRVDVSSTTSCARRIPASQACMLLTCCRPRPLRPPTPFRSSHSFVQRMRCARLCHACDLGNQSACLQPQYR
eukprot:365747-Chlamydomonas_euryale.AAC.60